MNEEYISLSKLLDEFYRRKITKGTLLRSLENYYSLNSNLVITYADSNYYACYDINKLPLTKKDIYKPDKTIKNNTQKIYLVRKNIYGKKRTIEFVISLFITKENIAKIDTQIFESKNGKILSYWFSQIEDFEDTLQESEDLILRKIDGMIIDVKEVRNEQLILTSSEKPKILKRFKNLDID